MSLHSACLRVCVTLLFCSSYQPFTPPSIHPSIHPSINPSLSIYPKAFQQVQPCGKQGNHVKWTADSSNYCGQAPSRWLSSSQPFAKCIQFPHEEIELLLFNCGRDAFKNCRGELNKIHLQQQLKFETLYLYFTNNKKRWEARLPVV